MSPILLEVNFLRWLNKSTLLLLVLENHYGNEAFHLQQLALQFLQIIEVHLLQKNVPPIVLIVRLTQSSVKSMSLDSQAIAFLIAEKQIAKNELLVHWIPAVSYLMLPWWSVPHTNFVSFELGPGLLSISSASNLFHLQVIRHLKH